MSFPMSEDEVQQALAHDAARKQAEAAAKAQAAEPARLFPVRASADEVDRARRRERMRAEFASAAQAALIFHSGYNVASAQTASTAVQHADALLAELERVKR